MSEIIELRRDDWCVQRENDSSNSNFLKGGVNAPLRFDILLPFAVGLIRNSHFQPV